jgi:hypothetical protein
MLELTDPTMKESAIQTATSIRARFLETISGFLDSPHLPELSDGEKDAILTRVINLLNTDTRPRFWSSLANQLQPRVVNGVVMLTPTLLKWAGKKKVDYKNKEAKQKAGHAANGRVVRSTRGL